MRNTADELEALLKVLDKAGADMFVEEAAQALSSPATIRKAS